MSIVLTESAFRAMFPRAPDPVVKSFMTNRALLEKAGILSTRKRLSFFAANVEHECGGFGLPGLTENTNYTATRMAQVWPNRFANAEAVRAKYGTAQGWQAKAFDDIYGGRMGNRPNSHDGSLYIGRGGPQWTGRDGYTALQSRTGIPAVDHPDQAARLDLQAAVCVAFWEWKKLNRFADVGDFKGCVKAWNGGTNGMADRLHAMEGNDPYINRLQNVDGAASVANALEGKPPTVEPPKEVIDEATKKERTARTASVGGALGGGTNEVVGAASPGSAPLPSYVGYTILGVCVGAFLITLYLIASKKLLVKSNWR